MWSRKYRLPVSSVDVEVFFARLRALEIKTLFFAGHHQPRLVSACQIENGRCRDAVVYFSLARLHACTFAHLPTRLSSTPAFHSPREGARANVKIRFPSLPCTLLPCTGSTWQLQFEHYVAVEVTSKLRAVVIFAKSESHHSHVCFLPSLVVKF